MLSKIYKLQRSKYILFLCLVCIGTIAIVVLLDQSETLEKPETPDKIESRRCILCNKINYTVENTHQSRCTSDVFFLILILSHPNNTEVRTVIRNTWAGVTSHRLLTIKHLFVVGKTGTETVDNKVRDEGSKHHDVLIMNIQESYFKLTEKIVTAFSWSLKNCHQFKYVLKTDDDAFNNPAKIVDFIISLDYPVELVSGKCAYRDKVCRDRTMKWSLTKEEYQSEYLPTFCRGPAYVLSHKTAESLTKSSQNVSYLKLEDVFLTGFVRQEYGIQPVQLPNFHMHASRQYSCYITNATTVHRVNSQEMLLLWKLSQSIIYRPFFCAFTYDNPTMTTRGLVLLVASLFILFIKLFSKTLANKCLGSSFHLS